MFEVVDVRGSWVRWFVKLSCIFLGFRRGCRGGEVTFWE